MDLIVTVHELLAEYGLCCAGKDNKGDEGTFLKFAINHLLALKSLHCMFSLHISGKERLKQALGYERFILYGFNSGTNSVEEDVPHDEQTKDDDLEDNGAKIQYLH